MFFRLSVGMLQHGSRGTDFHESLFLGIFRNSIERIHVSLKYDKNDGYRT
jgi:hypothetical protein